MAVEPTPDPLDRAVHAARSQQPEGWVELTGSIMSRVRAIVTPSAPLLTFAQDETPAHDDQKSQTYVSARVVTAAVRRLLQRDPTHAPEGIDLQVDDERLTEIQIRLVAAYRVELVALAEAVRSEVLATIRDLVGPDPELDRSAIGIDFVDVTPGDPNKT
jgi:uncharacterized alkaline shock family protein YloU